MEKKKKEKQGTRKGFVPVRGALDQAFSDIDKFHEDGNVESNPGSGYNFLNHLFISKEKPHFSIITVPIELGCTLYLGGSIITELAIKFKRKICCLSMQVSSSYYSSIMLSIVSGVDQHTLKAGTLEAERWPDISRAAGEIAGANIYIDDTRSHSAKSIRKSVQQLMKESEVDLLVIDTLQHISRKHKQARQAFEYKQICHSLRDLSEESGVSILLMSDFIDAYYPDDMHIAHDWDEPTAFQEFARIADAELCLRPGKRDQKERWFKLDVCRNREGATGTIELRRNIQSGRFEDARLPWVIGLDQTS